MKSGKHLLEFSADTEESVGNGLFPDGKQRRRLFCGIAGKIEVEHAIFKTGKLFFRRPDDRLDPLGVTENDQGIVRPFV